MALPLISLNPFNQALKMTPFFSLPYQLFSTCCLLLSISFSSCNSGYTDGVKTRLPVNEFQELLKKTPDALLIDVRTPEEYSGGHLSGSLNIDYNADDYLQRVSDLPKDKPVFVYCLSGGRSASAAKEMRKQGFMVVYEMDGGMMKWRASGLPEEQATAAENPGMNMDQYLALIPAGKNVLVDFYADWCEPCKKMKPWLEELSQSHADKVIVVRVDADKNTSLCKQLGIDALPVLKYYVDGKERWMNTGFIPREEAWKKLGISQ
jgi:rhodanese-related sulfurtransferase